MREGRLRGIAVALLLTAVAARGTPAAIEELSLYQRTARAAIVVRARALSSATRKPRLEVLEVLKGKYDHPEVTVIPHFEDNARPTPWLDREVFRQGEESILFMIPYADEFGRGAGPSTFSLLGAARGKLAVPAEGADALLTAIRRFSAILSLGQHDAQAGGLLDLLGESNPYLLEAGLQECARFALARPEDGGRLVGLLEHARPSFRAGALKLLAQVARDQRARGNPPGTAVPGGPESLLEKAASRLKLDAEPEVRRAAVGLLAEIRGAAALLMLEEAGRNDPSQSVRYEAQVAAHDLRSRPR